jgi:hypothetical protein
MEMSLQFRWSMDLKMLKTSDLWSPVPRHWEEQSGYIWRHSLVHRQRRHWRAMTRTDSSKETAHRFPRNQYQRRPFHWLVVIYFGYWPSAVTVFISGMITDCRQVNIVDSEKFSKTGRSNAVCTSHLRSFKILDVDSFFDIKETVKNFWKRLSRFAVLSAYGISERQCMMSL